MHSWFFNTQYNLSYLIPNCTQFKNSRSSSYWEIYDEKIHNHYIGEREIYIYEKANIEKEGKIIITTLVLLTAIRSIVLSINTKCED